jgi:hypothetical protein
MWRRNRRSHRQQDLRLESLEARELLSATEVAARPKTDKPPLAIYGSLQGDGEKSGSVGRGSFSFYGQGPEAPLGVAAFEAEAKSRTVLLNGEITGYNLDDGKAILTNEDGTRLDIQFAGYVYENGPIYAFSWTGDVVGGTGEYKGARGTFDTYGTFDISTGDFVDLSYTITLSRR